MEWRSTLPWIIFIVAWGTFHWIQQENWSERRWSLAFGLNTLCLEGLFFCTSCVYAKATWKLVAKMREGERVDVFVREVHSDLWGPAPVESKGGKRYYVTFIDDKSRLTILYLLKTKDKVPSVYKQYEAWVETQMGVKIKILNSDQGGEYQGNNFIKYLKSKGTIQKLNIHDTQQHTGVAKHQN